MARVKNERNCHGGLRAPGLYASLLDGEREACGRQDPRWRYTAAAGRGEECPPKYRRSRCLLEALEAEKVVVVPLPGSKWGLPWRRPEVTAVTVTPGDMVHPSTARFSYPGNAVDQLSDDSCMSE